MKTILRTATGNTCGIIAMAIVWMALAVITHAQTIARDENIDETMGRQIAASDSICLYVYDIGFRNTRPGDSTTVALEIANQGRGIVTFESPFLTWSSSAFSVSSADMEKLKAAKIGQSESIIIHVTFSAKQPGTYSTTARFWANTRSCRDVSQWGGNIIKAVPHIDGHDWGTVWRTGPDPCTKNSITSYDTTVLISNEGSANYIVKSIELLGDDARNGYFRLDTTNGSTAIRPGDTIEIGGMDYGRRQRILFSPSEERHYSSKLRLTTTDGDTVESSISGSGAESHLALQDFDFGTIDFSGASTKSLTITALPTRALTIDHIAITGPDAAAFNIITPLVQPIVLQPGDSLSVPIRFAPTSPGIKLAQLAVSGDHSRCDDSVILLRGTAAAAAVESAQTGITVNRIDPNPFSISTTLHFTIPTGATTTVEIWNDIGKQVALLSHGYLDAGEHTLLWDGGNYPSGLYYCRIISGSHGSLQPIVLRR